MNFINERAKDVSLIARCVINTNPEFRSFQAGAPSLFVSRGGGPLWLVPITNLNSHSYWDKYYYMFYYPENGCICFRTRDVNREPTNMYFNSAFESVVLPFKRGKIFNTYSKICELNSDEDGKYVKITYKLASLTKEAARKDFQSEYFIDRGWMLKSLKLVEIQDCVLRWVATMKLRDGAEFKISADPLGHFCVSEFDDKTADFEGKEPKENKDYFSLINTEKILFCENLVTLRYRNGSIELLNFGDTKKMPPKEIFEGIRTTDD